MFVDPKAIDFFSSSMVLVKLNGEVDTVLNQQYSVMGYPTSVIANHQGAEIDRIIGYAPTEDFLKMIQDYLAGIGTLDDLLGKANDSVDRVLYMEIADKYKYRGKSSDAESWFSKVVTAGQPTDSLSGEARLATADMYRRAKEFDRALAAYASVKKDFGPTMFGEAADIYSAIVLAKKGDTTAAVAAYKQFITEYPNSEDVEYAQKQIEKLTNPPKEAAKK